MTDPDFEQTYSLHFALVIQALNYNYNTLTLNTQLSKSILGFQCCKYDTSRYLDFNVGNGCPFAAGELIDDNVVEREFTVSGVDGETVIPASHRNYFPV